MSKSAGAIKRAFDVYIRDNPVVVKDLRTRMRGLGAYGLIIGYLLLISIVMCITYYTETGWRPTIRLSAAGTMGASLFTALAWTQSIVLMFAIPGVISSAIAREYENKTIEMLALSQMNSFLFVFGKLTSGLLYCLVLILSSLPLAGMCLMFGGISPEEIAITYLITISFCFMMCSTALYFSAILGKTIGAIMTYCIFCIFYLLQYMFDGLSLLMVIFQGDSKEPWSKLMLPALGASSSMDSATICGASIPMAVITVVLQTLIGTVLLCASAVKVKHWKSERTAIMRILLLITLVVFAVLGLGDHVLSACYGMSVGKMINVAPLAVLTSLVILSSIIGTGPIHKPCNSSILCYLFNPGNIFKPDLSGAIFYVTLASLLTYSAASLAFAVNPCAVPTSKNVYWMMILVQLPLVLSGVWLAACTGILFSAVFKNRVMAVIVSLSAVVIAVVAYVGTHTIFTSSEILFFTTASSKVSNWPDVPSIMIVSSVCIAISATCLALTSIALKKFGGVVE